MSKTIGNSITPWGRKCKAQMILLGISLKDLAKITGLSRNYISTIINGRIVAPKETTDKINKALMLDIPDTAVLSC